MHLKFLIIKISLIYLRPLNQKLGIKKRDQFEDDEDVEDEEDDEEKGNNDEKKPSRSRCTSFERLLQIFEIFKFLTH